MKEYLGYRFHKDSFDLKEIEKSEVKNQLVLIKDHYYNNSGYLSNASYNYTSGNVTTDGFVCKSMSGLKRLDKNILPTKYYEVINIKEKYFNPLEPKQFYYISKESNIAVFQNYKNHNEIIKVEFHKVDNMGLGSILNVMSNNLHYDSTSFGWSGYPKNITRVIDELNKYINIGGLVFDFMLGNYPLRKVKELEIETNIKITDFQKSHLK